MLFITASFGIGLAAYAGARALRAGQTLARLLRLPVTGLHVGGVVVLIAVAGSLLFCARRRRPIRIGRWGAEMPGPGLALLQLVLTAVDLVAAAAALWVLLPAAGRVDFATFSAIFAAATALGVISHLPHCI